MTFSCYRQRPSLENAKARDRFVQILDEVRARHRFRVIGYVVMPEHVHLLLTEPAKGNLSKVLQVLKQKVSRALRRKAKNVAAGQLLLEFARRETGDNAFWQCRFYDFNIWNGKKVKEKLQYMHANPVKRGLVGHPKDWPWSSWTHYAKGEAGLLRIDNLASTEKSDAADRFVKKGQNPHP